MSACVFLLLGALGAGGLALALSSGTSTKRPAFGADKNPTYCNGFRELRDRTLDQVAFPATHNSMSAGDYRGYYFANQTGTIAQQLRFGIRGLLLDAYYGIRDPKRNRVRTDLRTSEATKVAKALPP